MHVTLSLNPRNPHAVSPVVDYEPPVRDVRSCRQASLAAVRSRTGRLTRSPAGRETANRMSPALRPAAVFAEAALRRVLEVIDRRRPAAQLRPLLPAPLVDSVLSVNQMAAGRQAAAVLRRVRLQAVTGHDGRTIAAEVFGTYSRGRRIHAIACRVEELPASNGTQWQVVALHIG
ncbi:MAG: hypothetical protein JOZ23_11225 [Mycobacterium sp.]|nr:hypothetical protein [Mycobacterium sp.]